MPTTIVPFSLGWKQVFAIASALLLLATCATASLAQDSATLTPAAVPSTLFCGEATTYTWTYSPDGAGTPAVRGYSVRVQAPAGLSFETGDVVVLSPLGGVNDTYFVIENGPGDVTIDFAILEPGVGLTVAADLFEVTMTTDLHGTYAPSASEATFRDLQNADITMTLDAAPAVSVDCTAPGVPTLDAEPAFTAGTANTVSWSDESAGGAVTYNVQMATDGSFAAIADESGWIGGTSHQFTGLADGGTYFFRVASRNNLDVSAGYSGFESSTQDATAPITLVDGLAPTVRTMTIEVPIQFIDAGSGAGTVELFYRLSTGPWVSYGTFPGDAPIAFTAPAGDGSYDFKTQGTDAVGNVEPASSTSEATTILDTTGPYATFVIDDDAPAVNDTAVTLTIDAHRATEMRFSNDGVTWPLEWVPVAASYPWTIDGVAGVRTVYGEFRDGGPAWQAQDVVLYDVTATGPVTAPDAEPRHEGALVSWTAPVDPDWDHVEIWRGLVHDGLGASAYPRYSGVTVPTLPASPAAAAADPDWVLAGVSDPKALDFSDTVVVRGIYHYAVFAVDQAGNYSAAPASTARATNYVLGDIGLPYDGKVGVFDLSVLAAAYGASIIYPEFNIEADIGPTDDASGTGIPQPDQSIGFEDLMIASSNYSAGGKSTDGKSGPAASGDHAGTALLAWRQLESGAWALELREPCPALKGVRVAMDLPEGCVATVEPGVLLQEQPGPVFLQNIPARGLDAGLSVLGRGVGFAGAGVLMTVSIPGDVDPSGFGLVVRDVDNRDLAFEIGGKTGGQAPLALKLEGAYPNPFNPRTVIAYTLPAKMQIELAVYGLDGRRVAVLASGEKGPGRFEAVWDGVDHQGRPAASGVYFTRLATKTSSQVFKMTLMK